MTLRDLNYERELVDIAARSAGVVGKVDDLLALAQRRANEQGQVIRPRPRGGFATDLREELADAVNYACWWVITIRPWVDQGEAWACDEYVQAMSALVGVCIAWEGLHRRPA